MSWICMQGASFAHEPFLWQHSSLDELREGLWIVTAISAEIVDYV